MDLKTIPDDDLAALDTATAGRLSSALDVLLRVEAAGADHIDLQVDERWGRYRVFLTGLDLHDERVLGGCFTVAVDDDLAEPVKLVVLGLRLTCLRQRAERERRRFELRMADAATGTEPLAYGRDQSPARRKG